MALLWTHESGTVYTIGHSNHTLGRLIELLTQNEIDVLADTRSHPRSQFVPHFNGDVLKNAVGEHGVIYHFLGAELGGRPSDASLYDPKGHALYSKIALTDAFQMGIDWLVRERLIHRIALLCSEENPSVCHRRLLVTRVLREKNVPVIHIRGDGSLQTEQDLTRTEPRTHQPTLFGEPEQTAWRSLLPILRRSK